MRHCTDASPQPRAAATASTKHARTEGQLAVLMLELSAECQPARSRRARFGRPVRDGFGQPGAGLAPRHSHPEIAAERCSQPQAGLSAVRIAPAPRPRCPQVDQLVAQRTVPAVLAASGQLRRRRAPRKQRTSRGVGCASCRLRPPRPALPPRIRGSSPALRNAARQSGRGSAGPGTKLLSTSARSGSRSSSATASSAPKDAAASPDRTGVAC